ncbi:MAG: hypothetical protein CFH12_00352, partial [Alphaproteobacteria bacterium MarineAlpha5_Bin2]
VDVVLATMTLLSKANNLKEAIKKNKKANIFNNINII